MSHFKLVVKVPLKFLKKHASLDAALEEILAPYCSGSVTADLEVDQTYLKLLKPTKPNYQTGKI